MSAAADTARPVGKVGDFPAGRWTMVEVDGREVGIFNAGERFFAVRNKCPHEGAPICVEAPAGTMLPSAPGRFEYGLEGRVLTCPWHGWQFDLDGGEMVFGTGTRRLTTYVVEARGGVLYLDGPVRSGAAA
jgi:3-phenylpropionate/trans-cinnamate dioxygenase ferredoxin subunit